MSNLIKISDYRGKSDQIEINKICPSCKGEKPLTETYWYKARPREGHKKEGWQSYCRLCWPEINRRNKLKRKVSYAANQENQS